MAVVVVDVPSEFKRYAGGGDKFELEGSNVGEVLAEITRLGKGLVERVEVL